MGELQRPVGVTSTGNRNIGISWSALNQNCTGNDNVAIGAQQYVSGHQCRSWS